MRRLIARLLGVRIASHGGYLGSPHGHGDSIPVQISPGGKVYGDGLEFDDPGWRHTALCRECDTEGHFVTEDSRDAWMREHEKLGWAHRDWRTQSFDWE